MANTHRYEPDKDVQQVLRQISDEIPEAPERWTLDDFEDLLDPHHGEFRQTSRDAWM